MPTLDYLSSVPQSRTVISASIHLLVWGIVFFVIAGLMATYGVCSAFVLARECNGWELLVLITLSSAIFGTFALLIVLLGLRCMKTRQAILRAELFELRLAEKLFAALFALCGAGLVLSLIGLIGNLTSSGLQLAVPISGGFAILTFLTGWTRHCLRKTRKHLMRTN
jgi:hypothetical protein